MEELKDKSGVVYLSRIPTKMTVSILRDILSRYGDVGRIFLRPDERSTKKKRDFSEGWVEFLRKADAKLVASTLNNKPVASTRRSNWCDELWNIKFLHGFRWTMLHERLAYERETFSSRMRIETAQAKREADIFKRHVRASEKLLSEGSSNTLGPQAVASTNKNDEQAAQPNSERRLDDALQLSRKRERAFRQRRTDEEIVAEKRQRDAGNPFRIEEERRRKAASNEDFLKSIFT